MNFFQEKTSWTNAEFIPIKVCIASIYLIIGAYFHQQVMTYYVPVLFVFGIALIWSLYLWLRKMKTK